MLTVEHFADFFQAVHGVLPFPWQERLAQQVIADGYWPNVIALPTSAGKTAVIDIAVFALACAGASTNSQRKQARRIFFVIDRRVVVDQALDRARLVAARLEAALDGPTTVLQEAARRLRDFGGPVPLHVVALRGGMYRDEAWAHSPAQPVVCVSTVDQIGSRLLFRGYGLGAGTCNSLPIHAGLAGND